LKPYVVGCLLGLLCFEVGCDALVGLGDVPKIEMGAGADANPETALSQERDAATDEGRDVSGEAGLDVAFADASVSDVANDVPASSDRLSDVSADASGDSTSPDSAAPGDGSTDPSTDTSTDGSTDAPLACTTPPACADIPTETCNLGIWPNGIIYYEWASGDSNPPQDPLNQAVYQAMTDWQNVSSQMVAFTYSTSSLPRVLLTTVSDAVLNGQSAGGDAPGFSACAGMATPCGATVSPATAYHQLGHLIGLRNEVDRYDRNHYVIVRGEQHPSCDNPSLAPVACSDASEWARCVSPTTVGSFGPYDYESAMQSAPTHPDVSRWDDSPVVPGAICGECSPLLLPAQCSSADCTGQQCDMTIPNSGWSYCPVCSSCAKYQPGGLPTKGDGAAVVEMYAAGWGMFSRTVEDTGTPSPFDNGIAPGVTIAPGSSPALETWGGESLSIYVRGTDGQIYQRYKALGNGTFTWSSWLQRESGAFDSDPGEASWANGRSDIVARGIEGDIWIDTYSNGWSGWYPIGAPSVGADSSPSVASWGPDRLDVFVRGKDNELYVTSCTANCYANQGTWVDWQAIAGETFRGKPAVVSRDVGLNDVFVHATDGSLWSVSYDSTGPGTWYQVRSDALGWNAQDPCSDCYSPAATSRGSGLMDVIVRGQDDKAWIVSWTSTGGWTGYSALGGVLISSPASVSRVRDAPRIDLVAFMNEETSAGTYTPAAWWKYFPGP
jgi:hypothetical protein